MWLVEYSDEAAYYVDTNLPYLIELMLAIGRLMFTDDGKPAEGMLEPLDAGRYRLPTNPPISTHQFKAFTRAHSHNQPGCK